MLPACLGTSTKASWTVMHIAGSVLAIGTAVCVHLLVFMLTDALYLAGTEDGGTLGGGYPTTGRTTKEIRFSGSFGNDRVAPATGSTLKNGD